MRTSRRVQSGFALFFALVFLLMMTLVAVVAMRGTALELSMANNVANYEVAFEASESGRAAFVKPLPDMARCRFTWPSSVQSNGGGGACASSQCSLGGGNETGVHDPNYSWEPRATIDSALNTYLLNRASEDVNDPRTFVDEYKFTLADGSEADIAVVSLGSFRDPSGDASTGRGYEKPEEASSNFFEFVSSAERGGAVAQTASHFRLLNRDTRGECLSDLSYGGGLLP